MLSLLKIILTSFIKEILRSLCIFSKILQASAVLILGAKYTPAFIIFLYKLNIILPDDWSDPLTTLVISFNFFLSPGLILSGL